MASGDFSVSLRLYFFFFRLLLVCCCVVSTIFSPSACVCVLFGIIRSPTVAEFAHCCHISLIRQNITLSTCSSVLPTIQIIKCMALMNSARILRDTLHQRLPHFTRIPTISMGMLRELVLEILGQAEAAEFNHPTADMAHPT